MIIIHHGLSHANAKVFFNLCQSTAIDPPERVMRDGEMSMLVHTGHERVLLQVKNKHAYR